MAKGKLGDYKIVAIGGSAGSLDVIIRIMQALPEQTSTTFLVVVHRKNSTDNILTNLLSTKTKLPVKEVEDKEPLLPGMVYIAPPDYHLLVENEQNFSLDSSEKVNYSRPSIDVAFESVAAVFGRSAIAVLLSGASADGAKGLHKIKIAGGYTIVQDPASADMAYMPQQAINLGSYSQNSSTFSSDRCIVTFVTIFPFCIFHLCVH